MFQRHIDPGLPPTPALMVNAAQDEAYVKIRVPDWRAVERARYATQAFIVLNGVVTIVSAWLILPRSSDAIVHVGLTGLVSAVSIAVSAPVMRSALPGFLSRQVFARRLKICVTADWLAFKSWFYDNGIRIARRTAGRPLTIQPVVDDDVEAKAHAESMPINRSDGRRESRRHLSQASYLTLMLRSGVEPGVGDQINVGCRFRTLPVAGMDKKIAERLVILIGAALELTASKKDHNLYNTRGRDLDLKND